MRMGAVKARCAIGVHVRKGGEFGGLRVMYSRFWEYLLDLGEALGEILERGAGWVAFEMGGLGGRVATE